jgi:formylglycine-generating enzyme required for sulfatase activity
MPDFGPSAGGTIHYEYKLSHTPWLSLTAPYEVFMMRVANLLLCIMSICLSSCAQPVPLPFPSPAEANAKEPATAERKDLPMQITNSLGMKLSLIQAGRFTMGSPENELGRRPVEVQHEVTLTRSYYMGTTEVTQGQWKTMMGDNPSFVEGDDHPVETIPWAKAVEFCRKLSEKEGARYRLPTEAEWEYACRAGTTTPFHTGPTISTNEANYNGQRSYGDGAKGIFRDETTAVASFAPNAWGLHDMHGNVWEWCADWYAEYPTGAVSDPTGPAEGKTRVVRGGCWVTAPAVCRSASRGDTEPVSWNFHFGFRVARDL